MVCFIVGILFHALTFNFQSSFSYETLIHKLLKGENVEIGMVINHPKSYEELAICTRLAIINEDTESLESLLFLFKNSEYQDTIHQNNAFATIARLAHIKGEYQLADSLYLHLDQEVVQMDISDSLISLFHKIEKGDTKMSLGDYEFTDSLYTELANDVKAYTSSQPLFGAFFNEKMGILKMYQSKYELSEAHFDKAEIIWQNIGIQNHHWYYLLQNHRAILNIKKGEYSKAEKLLLNLKNKGCNNDKPLLCADIYSNLGSLYRLLNNSLEALFHYKKAQKRYLDKNNITEYALVTNNIALTYDNLDSIDLAIETYQIVIDTYRNTVGTSNLVYATVINNLAGLMDYEERYEEADSLYNESLSIVENTLGQKSDYYVTILSNIGILNESLDKLHEAEKAYLKCIDIRKELLGERHPKYVELLYNIAGLYSNLDSDKAIIFYKKANSLQLELLKYYYSSFDQNTRINYLNDMQLELERFYSLASRPDISTDIFKDVQELNISIKGLALEYHIGEVKYSYDASNNENQTLLKQWIDLRDTIAKTITQPIVHLHEKEIYLDDLLHKATILERKMVRASPYMTFDQHSYDDLEEAMDADMASLDFVRFEMFKDGFWTDTVVYYVLITYANGLNPKFVKICDEVELKKRLDNISINGESHEAFEHLYDLVWQPIAAHLEGFRQILITPSALMFHVPFLGLSNSDSPLLNKKELYTYGTLRDFLNPTLTKAKKKNILLIGDIDFDSDLTSEKLIIGDHFSSLSGTSMEVREIQQGLTSAGWDTKILRDKTANEQNLRTILKANSYSIIHLATHGFFYNHMDFPQYSDANLRNKLITHRNPLMRSGLVMSGVNQYWMAPVTVSGLEDGVLTSLEISNMSINSDLVVLSACESGLGDIHSEEGVFGLQRAFKMAGVDKLIMSLWKVPDKETAELMIYFYQNIAKQYDIHQAFIDAQKKMALKYAPFYWAGFVLIE